MKHLDLFSGIGGFALAVDTVWPNSEHIFCDNDKFCQQVLKKHWPNSKIYDDIRAITDTRSKKSRGLSDGSRQSLPSSWKSGCDILTGGFPCQPFSQAGKRRGTTDDRYLWPEMLRVIQLAKPQWVVAENVRGLLTQSGGLVFEQVCLDLEASGYEVQPFIIPAVAKNAPHRRDRVWFIANRQDDRGRGWDSQERRDDKRKLAPEKQRRNIPRSESQRRISWSENWLEVATRLCGVDDGLSVELDGFELTKAGHRTQRLKSLGNAIVPQVAIEIMRAIPLRYFNK
jgi:DNA (cytosine-5)-methyltransferase 1